MYTILTFFRLYFSIFFVSSLSFVLCLMIVVYNIPWNLRSQTRVHALKYIYIKWYIFTYYYYIIVLSQILCTLQIISHLVCNKPRKWDRDNQHCSIYPHTHTHTHTYIYIYIYIYIYPWSQGSGWITLFSKNEKLNFRRLRQYITNV